MRMQWIKDVTNVSFKENKQLFLATRKRQLKLLEVHSEERRFGELIVTGFSKGNECKEKSACQVYANGWRNKSHKEKEKIGSYGEP